jgi:hypothetical protein
MGVLPGRYRSTLDLVEELEQPGCAFGTVWQEGLLCL